MRVLVDTNVLLDIVSNDPIWLEWSITRVREALGSGAVVIDAVIYAELSVGLDSVEAVDAVLLETGVTMVETPRFALFLAGKTFHEYKKRGGPRTGVLPDLFIGAHASAARIPLITRDARRYRSYFPDLKLITPHQ